MANMIRRLYTASGPPHFVAPARVTLVRCWLLGGGGGGGGSFGSGDGIVLGRGAAGGGGARLVHASLGVTPGTSYAVAVAAGGLGGTAGNTSGPVAGGDGGSGGTTSLGALISAVGAQGGRGAPALSPAGAGTEWVMSGGPVVGLYQVLGVSSSSSVDLPLFLPPGYGGIGFSGAFPGDLVDGQPTAWALGGAGGGTGGGGGAGEWPGSIGGASGLTGSGFGAGGGGASGTLTAAGAVGGVGRPGFLIVEWEN